MKLTTSPEETMAVGHAIGSALDVGNVLCLYGDLGAGKTTLIKGIAAAVTGCVPETVTSPTFTYLHIYEGKPPFYHFDLYRLSGSDHFFQMGFEEFLGGDGIACIEWPERMGNLPPGARSLYLRHCGRNKREIVYG